MLAEKMIQFLQGMTKKWVNSTTQTVDKKRKAKAKEQDLPWHVIHDDGDDNDGDDDCVSHNIDDGNDDNDNHLWMPC